MSSLKRNLTRRAFRWFETWAPDHPDIVLHDPKSESRAIDLGIPRSFRILGREIRINVQNMRQYKRWRTISAIFGDGAPDKAVELDLVHRWLCNAISDDSVLFDIGSNVGVITVLAGLLRPKARTFAFEAEPNSYLQLCETIAVNGINATAYHMAISDRCRLGTFNVNRSFDAALSNHQLDRTVTNTGKPFEPVIGLGIPVFSIDSLVYDHGLATPTLVKIDVDGIDPEVIEGMERLLSERRLVSVITEATGDENVARISRVMERHGYVCVHGAPPNLGNRGCNLVFDRG